MKLIKVKIQGKEVQAALLNPDVARRYEEGHVLCAERCRKALEIAPASDALREQCQAVIDYVGSVFGTEGAQTIFGKETDVLSCLDVYEEMTQLYESQVMPVLNARMARLKKDIREEE